MENKKTSLGLDENVEALLTYVLGWITGIVFLVIEKESKFVRFHALQSTLAFLGLTVLSIILTPVGILPLIGILVALVNWIIWVIGIITWIVCMIKAYQGQKFKLPIIGNIAEKHSM